MYAMAALFNACTPTVPIVVERPRSQTTPPQPFALASKHCGCSEHQHKREVSGFATASQLYRNTSGGEFWKNSEVGSC
jgi:hypothetical protein